MAERRDFMSLETCGPVKKARIVPCDHAGQKGGNVFILAYMDGCVECTHMNKFGKSENGGEDGNCNAGECLHTISLH